MPNLSQAGLSRCDDPKERLWIRAPFTTYTGYGLHASYTARWLLNQGHTLELNDLVPDSRDVPDDLSDLVTKASGSPGLLIAPNSTQVRDGEWFFTMHETTRLPQRVFDNINRARAVIVPSTWNQQCFNAQGVKPPVYVVPIGINSGLFKPAKHKPRLCTFGSAGNLALSGFNRKNTEAIITAFTEAFEGVKDVRLKLKVSPECSVPDIADTRVEINRKRLTEFEMSEWFRSLTAYVSPSRCEAFGQMNLQAMSCGLPLICCPFGGVTDYHTDYTGYSIDYSLVEAKLDFYDCGLWAEPSVDSLIGILRHIYAERCDAEMKGAQATIVANSYDWSSIIAKFKTVLKIGGFWSTKSSTVSVMDVESAPKPESKRETHPNVTADRSDIWAGALTCSRKAKTPLWLAQRTGGHEPVFYMSGDLGDLVYALPTLRALGGGQLCLGPARDHCFFKVRETIGPARFKAIAPLLEIQKQYLSKVTLASDMRGWKCDVDLNDLRRLHHDPYWVPNRNLVDVVSMFFGLGTGLWRDKWLEVDEVRRAARFVFMRSPRYHVPSFPWAKIVKKHGKDAVFVGLTDEYEAFVSEFGNVSHYPTKDLLDVARVVAGAECVVANQSCPLAIAEGVKANIVREDFVESCNCQYDRDGNTADPTHLLSLC